jgi:hypothetical protein
MRRDASAAPQPLFPSKPDRARGALLPRRKIVLPTALWPSKRPVPEGRSFRKHTSLLLSAYLALVRLSRPQPCPTGGMWPCRSLTLSRVNVKWHSCVPQGPRPCSAVCPTAQPCRRLGSRSATENPRFQGSLPSKSEEGFLWKNQMRFEASKYIAQFECYVRGIGKRCRSSEDFSEWYAGGPIALPVRSLMAIDLLAPPEQHCRGRSNVVPAVQDAKVEVHQ